jgi:ubiquitin C-terminal hydrolase
MEYEKKKYSDRGLTGLANLGNSCYKNSCMQILSHTYRLNDLLEDQSYKKRLNKIPDSILLVEWDKLRTLMWSENCTVSPAGWNQAVGHVAKLKDIDTFLGYSQNDLTEFLLFIIDGFHNALKREVDMTIKGDVKNSRDQLAKSCFEMMQNMYRNEYSEILQLFYGIHVSQIISDTNKVLSNNPEPYFMLDLPMVSKENISILDCLDEYIKPERLEGENAWYNEKKKKKEDVSKGIAFFSFPDILVLSIKRFNYVNRSVKDNRLVDFPLENLNLTDYCKGYHKESYIYDLYGVCNHIGSSDGGHYTAHIKNANGMWYNFNDTMIQKISDINKTVISNEAYCLFYEKKKN